MAAQGRHRWRNRSKRPHGNTAHAEWGFAWSATPPEALMRQPSRALQAAFPDERTRGLFIDFPEFLHQFCHALFEPHLKPVMEDPAPPIADTS
jgi:hypothetical protein